MQKKVLIRGAVILLIITVLCLLYFTQNQTLLKEIENDLKKIAPNVDFILSENKISDTTFTLDKRYIFLCLNTKNKNTLMYVAIHELAHIITKEYGHGNEFITNFQMLLKKAIDFGIYKFVDYSQSPERYCNMTLNTMILK